MLLLLLLLLLVHKLRPSSTLPQPRLPPQGAHLKALLMAMRLNDPQLLQHVVLRWGARGGSAARGRGAATQPSLHERPRRLHAADPLFTVSLLPATPTPLRSTPPAQVPLLANQLPAAVVPQLLAALGELIPQTPHIEYLLRWGRGRGVLLLPLLGPSTLFWSSFSAWARPGCNSGAEAGGTGSHQRPEAGMVLLHMHWWMHSRRGAWMNPFHLKSSEPPGREETTNQPSKKF